MDKAWTPPPECHDMRLISFGSSVLFGGLGRRSQLLPQIDPRERPIALHGTGRHAEELGGLLHREPPEVAQFDDTSLARILLGQPAERLVDGEHLFETLRADREPIGEFHTDPASAAYRGAMSPAVIDQHPAHDVCGHA